MENTFEIKVRKITEKDWDFLESWWHDYPAWEGSSIPREMLPGSYGGNDPGLATKEELETLGHGGFIAYKDETPICACWLFLTNSKLAHVAPVVSNKHYRDTDRGEAIKKVIHFATHVAYELGYEYAHAWSSHENFTKIYEDIGYTGQSVSELTIKL